MVVAVEEVIAFDQSSQISFSVLQWIFPSAGHSKATSHPNFDKALTKPLILLALVSSS